MTTCLHSKQNEDGLSRRDLVQALVAGTATASLTTAAAAQRTSVFAEATATDHVRDPTRWGSADVAALFPGFKHLDMRTKGAIIRCAMAVPARRC